MTSHFDSRTDDPDHTVPVVRVRNSGDLVAAIPYLIGFHPTRSLVLVGLDSAGPGRVIVTARVDLDDVAASPPTLAHTLASIARGRARALFVAIFDDDALPDIARVADAGPVGLPWAGLCREVLEAADQVHLDVDEVALVAGGRSWSYLCDQPWCCPPEGRVLDESAAAAECTYAGMVALPDRASLAAILDPLPDAERDRLLPALDLAQFDAIATMLPDIATATAKGADAGPIATVDRAVKRAIFAAARRSELAASKPVDDDQVIRFATALQRVAVRNPVWLAIDDGRLDGRSLWRDLARRLPAPFDAPALFLYAWACYRDGNGALAGIAAERALVSDPGFTSADLVLAALASAVDPRSLPRLRIPRRSA